jgi:hypothetical protein
MRPRIVAGLVVLVTLTASVATAAPSDPCAIRDKDEYILWFDSVTSALFQQGVLETQILDLQRETRAALGQDIDLLSARQCSNPGYLATLRKKDHEGLQGFLDKFVVMGIAGSGPDLEYFILPYLLDQVSPPKLTVLASCGKDGAPRAEGQDPQRIQAYAYAALALYEIRRLESRRDAGGAHRAEILMQRALSKMAELDARAEANGGGDRTLLDHLQRKCQRLETIIDEMGTAAGMPAQSHQLAKLIPSKNSICAAR